MANDRVTEVERVVPDALGPINPNYKGMKDTKPKPFEFFVSSW